MKKALQRISRRLTCTDLAAVISALEQAMKLKLAPSTTFEMGFLAMIDLTFLPSLIKCQGGQGFLSKWFLFCITDISEKVRRSRVERRLFEPHSMLQCRDNCRSIEQEIRIRVYSRGAFIRIVHLHWPGRSYWNKLWSSNKHHSTFKHSNSVIRIFRNWTQII